jgi:hypothetical protein
MNINKGDVPEDVYYLSGVPRSLETSPQLHGFQIIAQNRNWLMDSEVI